MTIAIQGRCEPAFAGVHEAFAANFAERGEVGAAVCVVVDGRTVVDLVGGWADEEGKRPWQPDTLVNYYSVGKAVVALLALQLVDAGVIGLDDPIASVWPEFGVAGKTSATIRHALCHRAGVDVTSLAGDALMVALGYFNPPGYSSRDVVNTVEWRSTQVPSTNGHGSATGVARLYAALLEPGRLLSPRSSPKRPPRSRRGTARCLPTTSPSASGSSRRSRLSGRVRVRDEPRHPTVAEHAQPRTDRRRLPIAVTGQSGSTPA